MKTPWKESPLDEWSIIGMNHYHQNGQKRLFVAMTKNNTSIVEEGLDDDKLWERLKLKASALKDKTNFEEAADKTFIKLVTMKDKDFDDFIKEHEDGDIAQLLLNSKRWEFYSDNAQTALILGSELDPNDKTVNWKEECNKLADKIINKE